jgi:hypothetical protein
MQLGGPARAFGKDSKTSSYEVIFQDSDLTDTGLLG